MHIFDRFTGSNVYFCGSVLGQITQFTIHKLLDAGINFSDVKTTFVSI